MSNGWFVPADAAFIIVIVMADRPTSAPIKPDGAVYGNVFPQSLFTGYHQVESRK